MIALVFTDSNRISWGYIGPDTVIACPKSPRKGISDLGYLSMVVKATGKVSTLRELSEKTAFFWQDPITK